MAANAQAICLLACQNAKASPGMVGIAGQYLNLVLEDLCLNRDLKVNQVTATIAVAPGGYGPFPLEVDYLRTYDLWYPLPAAGGALSSSMTQFLIPITMEQWDSEFKSPSISNYPYEYATDLSVEAQTWTGVPHQSTLTSAGQLWIYPQTSGQIVMTHRYMIRRPGISNPQSSGETPWFTYSDYLITEVASKMMGITGDDRKAQYHADAERMLGPYLVMGSTDEQEAVKDVKLDPRRFRFTRNLKPTKAAPL